jgi:hypothetical protein
MQVWLAAGLAVVLEPFQELSAFVPRCELNDQLLGNGRLHCEPIQCALMMRLSKASLILLEYSIRIVSVIWIVAARFVGFVGQGAPLRQDAAQLVE